jgi:hypothetical protein
MRAGAHKIVGLITAALLLVFGAFLLGRISQDTHAAHQRGYQAGLSDGYIKGLPVGEAQGREDGRALQDGDALSPADRQPLADSFEAGYAAGTNDAFAGYDGGWDLSTPYVVTIQAGQGQINYRIRTREPMQAHVNYYLCPNGHDLCHQSRS